MMFEEVLKKIEELKFKYTAGELQNAYNQALDDVLSILSEQQKEQNGWIPVSSGILPEEKINPYTHDYYEYQCTFETDRVIDIRYYKFGDGHWWHGGGCMDKYVTAWRKLPEPFNQSST